MELCPCSTGPTLMSSSQPPLLLTILPKYASSMYCIILSSTLAFILSTLVFLALILRPTFSAFNFRLLFLLWRSWYFDDRRAKSSAKSKCSNLEVKFHLIPVGIPVDGNQHKQIRTLHSPALHRGSNSWLCLPRNVALATHRFVRFTGLRKRRILREAVP